MDLFELSATLGINTDPFTSGLQGALGFAGRVANQVGNMAFDFGKDVIDTGLEFDKAMSGVFAVTQTTDEGVQKMLEDAAIAEAQVSAFTTAEAAMAEYYEGLAGYDTQEVVDGLHAIIVAAEAAGESLPTVADIITDVNRAFNGEAKDQEHVADVLAATATATNTTITKLGQSFKYTAPLAGALGYSIEDVAITFGLMADRGTKASQAGTALRNILTRISTNAGATSTKLGALDVITDKLGVDFYDSERKVRPWITVVDEARDAWRGLNEEDKNGVLDAFAQLAVGGKNADEVLKSLKKDSLDVSNILDQYNKEENTAARDKYADSIRGIASSYSELFKLLGMDVDPTSDNVKDLAGALERARFKLGEMTDEEKVYFATQIGSLRASTGWLELMNATAESYDNVKEAVYGAAGAAEEMRDIRMGSNLYGDVQQLSASYDALKTTIYQDTRGPMREIVQEATRWIDDIKEAIGANGLQGGIDMLATHIEQLGDDEHFKSLLESIGGFLGSVVDGMLNTVLPKITESAPDIGGAFIKGIIGGFEGSNNPFASGIAGLLGHWFNTDMSNGAGSLTGTNNVFNASVNLVPTAKEEEIQAAIDEAQAAGRTTVMVDGIEFSTDYTAAEIADALSGGITDGTAEGAVNMEGILDETGNTVSSDLLSDLGEVGDPAGESIASGIQNALNRQFTIVVDAIVNGLPQGVNVRRNASAMTSGRIFNRPTVFGYADGAYQVAGDAGPEAVVGVNSLSGMIASAVRGAIPVVTPGSQPRQLNVILELDRRELARTVYELNKQETQRVGMSFSNARL